MDVALECTGVLNTAEGLEQHLKAGAKRAILSAPARSGSVPFVVGGVNRPGDARMYSCASCTTNAITPVTEAVGRRIGLAKDALTTVHAYTASQAIIDCAAKKPERGCAGAVNLVPTTTGAARATTEVLPEYRGRFDGLAIRAPAPNGRLRISLSS